MIPSRRKKWTEEEERTLIDKYGEMFSDGTLAKMKTREKKFRPIAGHVNLMHHARDPVAFPWQWSWKDASTKVQNMRHQYLLVKQKIKKPITASASASASASAGENQSEEFDWFEGLTYWPNFLRYKDVFGDIALEYNNSGSMTATAAVNRDNGRSFARKGPAMDIIRYSDLGPSPNGSFGVGIADGDENGVLELGFEYDGDEVDENNNNNNNNNHMKEEGDEGFEYEEVETYGSELRRKKKRLKGFKRAWSFLVNQFEQLREREARFEDRERERQRREQYRAELEQERERMWEEKEKEWEEGERVRENMRRERFHEWKAMEERAERERQRRDEELRKEREWEERMERRRLEWKKRMDSMLSQQQVAMNQIQSRILHDQQALAGQLIGLVSQWTGHPAGLSDHTGGNPYLSPMMQNLHNVNGIVHGENRVDGENQDDQFIVDG